MCFCAAGQASSLPGPRRSRPRARLMCACAKHDARVSSLANQLADQARYQLSVVQQVEALLSDDFQFVAPIVGPLSKAEFLAAFGSFKVKDAFPDIQDNSWFKVDPLEPNRVWFVSRATGTHTGTLNFGWPRPPTGKVVESPPQAQSMLFNEAGLIYTLTVFIHRYEED